MGCSDSVSGDTLVVIPFERMSLSLRPLSADASRLIQLWKRRR